MKKSMSLDFEQRNTITNLPPATQDHSPVTLSQLMEILANTGAKPAVIPNTLDGARISRKTGEHGSRSSFTALVLGNAIKGSEANGGSIMGASFSPNESPFAAFTVWDDGVSRKCYYGGGGFDAPEATEHVFVTSPNRSEEDNTGKVRLVIDKDGVVKPGSNGEQELGSEGARWGTAHLSLGPTVSSDRRDKEYAYKINFASALVESIEPNVFSLKGESAVQVGFDAQDFADNLRRISLSDLVLCSPSDKSGTMWVRHDQLVAILWASLKETRAELLKLKSVVYGTD